jgi:LPS O-antigen subunit length determinant protein (WzzB/FepE family)
LNDVVKAVQRDHTVLFEDNRRPISDRLQNLEEQRATLQKQYADLTALIERLKASDSVQASLMMLQRGAIVDSLNQQDMERLRLAQQITPPQTRPTELLGEIVAPAKASRPKKMLVLAFSAAFGLMMGVILAFLMDFLAKAKPPERSADITYR